MKNLIGFVFEAAREMRAQAEKGRHVRRRRPFVGAIVVGMTSFE